MISTSTRVFPFDAAANSTGATPEDAYRFAKGEVIPFFPIGAGGEPEGGISIDRPLDFVAVTDHGEFLGERPAVPEIRSRPGTTRSSAGRPAPASAGGCRCWER